MTVQNTNPAQLQVNVSRNQALSVTFSKSVSFLSVTQSTVSFSSPYGVVAGSHLIQGSVVTFTPAAGLPLSVPITGTVTVGVKGAGGEQLAQNYSWTFRTENAPQAIAAGQLVHSPRVAASEGGLVMAMFVNADGAGGDRLFARHYLPATGWNPAEELPVNASPVSNLEVRCTADNEAVAVWAEGNVPRTVRSARFIAGQGWQQVANLGPMTGGTITFRMNDQGMGAIQNPGFIYLDEDGTWQSQAPGSIRPWFGIADNGDVFSGDVAVNPAIGSGSVHGTRFVLGAGWTDTPLQAIGMYYSVLALAGAPGGETVLVMGDDGQFQSWRFNGTGWTAMQGFGAPLGYLYDAEITLGPTGDGCLVWRTWNGSAYSVWGSSFDAANGWGGTVPLETSDAAAGETSVAVTGAGVSWVVWTQADEGIDSIWRAIYDPNGGWSLDTLNDDDLVSWNPRIAAGGNVGAAVWFRYNGGQTEVMATILD